MNAKTDLLIAIGASTVVMGLLTVFVIYFVIIYRKKQRAFEWEREAFKRALLQTEIEIKEQTLSNISRELHDNLGQMASLIKINLNLALPNLQEEDQSKILVSLDLLKQLIQDIKSLSVSLKGENLARFGLLKMIEKDIERYEKIGGLKIKLIADAHLPKFETADEIFLYRMSQEIFNNTLKHAHASEVEMRMSYDNEIFEMHIADNGCGFDTTQKKNGSGLLNLRERCEIIDANLSMESKVNQGTAIKIEKRIK